MNTNELTAWFVAVVTIILALAFFGTTIDADRHYSDPEVYERYVEDMRAVGRKPNGEPLEPYERGGE